MNTTKPTSPSNEAAQSAPGGHDPIVALETEMIRQRDITNSGLDNAAVAHHSGKCFDLIREIASTPARTPPDLAAQARTLEYVATTWGSDWDGLGDFASAVREGAERLAGGAP